MNTLRRNPTDRIGTESWPLRASDLRRPINVLLLCLVICVAAFLRLWSLSSQGFMHWDEGLYALEGQFLKDTWLHLAGLGASGNWPPGGRPPVFQKPLHSALISLGMLAGGTSAASAQFVSATTGILTVVLVFVLGWRAYSLRTGLLAAGLLATMPLHVVYSRLALAESNGTFIFSLSVLAYWLACTSQRRRSIGLVAAGLLLGLSIITNLRLYVMPALFVITELFSWLRDRGQRRPLFLRRIVILAYSAAVPLAATFVFFWWLRDYYHGMQVPLRFPILTYEQQLGGFWNQQNSYGRPFLGGIDPLYYPFVAWTFAGSFLICCALLFVGTAVRDRKRLAQDVLIALWLLVPVVFFSLLTDKAPRFISIALPALSILAARGVSETFEWLQTKPGQWSRLRLIPAVLCAAAMATGAWWSYDMSQKVSGYPEAAAYVIQHGAKAVVASQALPVEFLTRQSIDVADIPDDASLLKKGYAEGYKYVLVDDQGYLTPSHRSVSESIETSIRPVASFPDTLKQGPLFVLEHSEWLKVNLETTMELYQEIRSLRGVSEVKVYDLGQYLSAVGSGVH